MLLPRGGHKEALFRHKVREAFEQEKELALARPLALSFSRFVSTPNKTPLKKKKNSPADPDLLPLRSAFARVVAPLAAALCLCNADRICLAVAIVPMAAELGWKPATQGEGVFFRAFFSSGLSVSS